MNDATRTRHPDVLAAIDFGIDITWLEANLRLTRAERLREVTEMNRSQAETQARTVRPALLERTGRMRMRERLARPCAPDREAHSVDEPATD